MNGWFSKILFVNNSSSFLFFSEDITEPNENRRLFSFRLSPNLSFTFTPNKNRESFYRSSRTDDSNQVSTPWVPVNGKI